MMETACNDSTDRDELFLNSKQKSATYDTTDASESVDHFISPPRTNPTGLRGYKQGGALQQLSSLLGQKMKLENVADLKGSLPTIPINDLRGEEAVAYHREDCVLRRSLAALYRLIDIRGWTQSIYNHISARCTTNPDHFLINPFGLLYHEIQASSLIKIDDAGNVIDQGSSVLGVNKAGWTLHSALHSARKDVNCIIHVHLPDVIAVSCLRVGLLPVSPEAIELITNSGVCYHDYRGILVDESERASIQQDLGPKAKILFLRNHGVAIAANSIPEAWYLVKRVVAACQTQMRLLQLSGGASLLAELKESASQLELGNNDVSKEQNGELNSLEGHDKQNSALVNGRANSDTGDAVWTPEELEFEAEMRVLDSAGFRTGHIYRQPNLLRRAHLGSTWAGDTLGDQMTGAELLTTDFSTNEFSAVEDVAAAEAAGAEQIAKIVDHVRSSRQKNAQRNQWLTKVEEPPSNGLVASSMIASPNGQSSIDPSNCSIVRPFNSPDSPLSTPVKRPGSVGQHADSTFESHKSVQQGYNLTNQPVHNGSVTASVSHTSANKNLTQSGLLVDSESHSQVNKSATLPASIQHLVNKANANTLQSVDGVVPNDDGEDNKTLGKKIKKKGSFRMPSFSRKKKN